MCVCVFFSTGITTLSGIWLQSRLTENNRFISREYCYTARHYLKWCYIDHKVFTHIYVYIHIYMYIYICNVGISICLLSFFCLFHFYTCSFTAYKHHHCESLYVCECICPCVSALVYPFLYGKYVFHSRAMHSTPNLFTRPVPRDCPATCYTMGLLGQYMAGTT